MNFITNTKKHENLESVEKLWIFIISIKKYENLKSDVERIYTYVLTNIDNFKSVMEKLWMCINGI